MFAIFFRFYLCSKTCWAAKLFVAGFERNNGSCLSRRSKWAGTNSYCVCVCVCKNNHLKLWKCWLCLLEPMWDMTVSVSVPFCIGIHATTSSQVECSHVTFIVSLNCSIYIATVSLADEQLLLQLAQTYSSRKVAAKSVAKLIKNLCMYIASWALIKRAPTLFVSLFGAFFFNRLLLHKRDGIWFADSEPLHVSIASCCS